MKRPAETFIDGLVSNAPGKHSWYAHDWIKQRVIESEFDYFDCAEYLENNYGYII